MKTTTSNDYGQSALQNRAEEEIRGRGGEKLPGKMNNPGGGGSRERVPAKGNDITHEDDLLQSDIEDEVGNALDEGLGEQQQ